MKNNIIENIRLEMKRHKSMVRTSVRVGDVATRTLHITLSDSGDLVSLEHALLVEIWVKKPDGKKCYNNCVISGDEIQYTITSQTINVPGICTCQLQITYEDGEVIYSPEFAIVVYEPAVNQNVIRSENEYTALTEQVVMAKSYAKDAKDALDSIGDAEENASASADRAEEAESKAKSYAEIAEDARDDVKAYSESAILAAENAGVSEKAVSEFVIEAKTLKESAVNAANSANISAENAATSENAAKAHEENAGEYAEGMASALEEASSFAEQAAVSESNAEGYANRTQELCNEFGKKLANLENDCQTAYEHSLITNENPHKTTAEQIGLGEVDNTSDDNKPVSTAQKAAIDAVQNNLTDHAADTSNPHKTTAKQIGLGDVDNTPDISKPVSTPQQAAIDAIYANAIAYIDKAISDLINGAPSTLNTLGEIADAMAENEDVVTTLNDAVGKKANQAELDTHTGNSMIHVTSTDKSNWGAGYTHSQKTSGNPHGVTKSNVGLGNVPNVATNDQTPTYTLASEIAALTSGEKLSVAFGKIAKAVSSLISHLANKSNPHSISKSQVGLGNVTNEAQYCESNPQPSVTGSSGSCTGNSATATKWANARNFNGMSVQGDANRVNYGTCSTAAATTAKTVACTGFALITGAEITVKFTYKNTAASPTLNVNSTGAKAIYYRGAAITAGYLVAKGTYTFRYNGTQWDLVGDIIEGIADMIGYPHA